MPDPNRRHRQVSEAIRDELVTIIRKDISDPRLEAVGFITVSGVELASDMKDATVWVSFMGKEEKDPQVQEAIAALRSAANFIHRLLIKRIPMKMHPRLSFKFDKMFDRAATVSKALAEAAEVERETAAERARNPEPGPKEEE